jgi:hypothetical protein
VIIYGLSAIHTANPHRWEERPPTCRGIGYAIGSVAPQNQNGMHAIP